MVLFRLFLSVLKPVVATLILSLIRSLVRILMILPRLFDPVIILSLISSLFLLREGLKWCRTQAHGRGLERAGLLLLLRLLILSFIISKAFLLHIVIRIVLLLIVILVHMVHLLLLTVELILLGSIIHLLRNELLLHGLSRNRVISSVWLERVISLQMRRYHHPLCIILRFDSLHILLLLLSELLLIHLLLLLSFMIIHLGHVLVLAVILI